MQFLLIYQFIISFNLLTMAIIFATFLSYYIAVVVLFFLLNDLNDELFYFTFQINYRAKTVVAGAGADAVFRF